MQRYKGLVEPGLFQARHEGRVVETHSIRLQDQGALGHRAGKAHPLDQSRVERGFAAGEDDSRSAPAGGADGRLDGLRRRGREVG